jgi:1,2-diacylglycerol 3-alpha-glucosyltransferase
MRIALFTNNYFPRISGVSVAVQFQHDALLRHGHKLMVVSPDYARDPETPGVNLFRVTSLALPHKFVSVPLATAGSRALREAVDDFEPDLIHSHHPFVLGIAAMELANVMGVPLCYTFHTLYDYFTHYIGLDLKSVNDAVRDYVIEYASRCDAVVAPTAPVGEYLVASGCRTPVTTIPTGIDLRRFDATSAATVERLRTSFGTRRFDHVLLSVGRITKEKNVGRCIDALAELVGRGHNCGLLLLGNGPDVDLMQAYASRLGVGRHLIMGGFLDQDDLAAAYALGDVFLFPSPSDTQGIVLYEALVSGLPIVATRTMASRAAVQDQVNGLFAADSGPDFADKIESILTKPWRFDASLDTEAYSYESVGHRYHQLYAKRLAAGRRHDADRLDVLNHILSTLSPRSTPASGAGRPAAPRRDRRPAFKRGDRP